MLMDLLPELPLLFLLPLPLVRLLTLLRLLLFLRATTPANGKKKTIAS